MTMYTTALSKLPKWAQERISIAEMRAAEADRRVAEMVGDVDGSIIRVRCWSASGEREFRLPQYAHIRFLLHGENDWIEGRVEEDRLYLTGSRHVVIRPEASNTFTVGVEN